MKHTQADTSHIEACRIKWRAHHYKCFQCHTSLNQGERCELGQSLYDEYAASIEANRSCEAVEATLPKEPQS